MPMSCPALAAVVSALTVVLTSCTAPAPAVSRSPEPAVRQLWIADVDLIGWPTVADDSVASYVRDNNGLAVAAWDLATGDELWRRRAAVGGEAPGVMIDLDQVRLGTTGYVAYLTPTAMPDVQAIEVADIRTGRPLALDHREVWSTSRPQACDEGSAFCLTGYLGDDEVERALRIDPSTRRVTRDRETGLPDHARFLGERVFATNDRAPDGVEQLGFAQDGKVLWRRPYQDVFGPGATSDAGWDWADGDAREVLIGSGHPEDGHWDVFDETGEASSDATEVRTVGLERATGRTLWELDGVETCPFVDLNDVGDNPVVLCRIRAGSQHWKRTPTGIDYFRRGYDVDVIGVDPVSGAELWAAPIGGEEFDHEPGGLSFVSSEKVAVIRLNRAAVRLDNRTGTFTPVGPEDVLACSEGRPEFVLERDGRRDRWAIGDAMSPCDRDLRKLSQWSVDVVRTVGVEAGENRWLLPTLDGLVAVQA